MQRFAAQLSVGLVAANAIALNLWLAPVAQARVDLTENGDYSLSDTTKHMVSHLDEPLLMRAYFSGKMHPILAPLVPQIRVKAGEPVTVRLTSLDNQHHTDGGGQHQWAVDELGVNVIAQPLSSNTVTFTPEKSGEYTFYCDICCGGRANPTMNGTLIVEA